MPHTNRKLKITCGFCSKWFFIGTAVTNHRQSCNRLHQMEKLMKPSCIVSPPQVNSIDMTESIHNGNVVPPVTHANNQEVISHEQMCDDYKDQLIQESMVGNNYDFDDFNIAEYEEDDEVVIDIHDRDNDTSSTTKAKKNELNENSLFNMLLNYNEIQQAGDVMTNLIKYSIELLTLLQNSNISNTLYDKIVDRPSYICPHELLLEQYLFVTYCNRSHEVQQSFIP